MEVEIIGLLVVVVAAILIGFVIARRSRSRAKLESPLASSSLKEEIKAEPLVETAPPAGSIFQTGLSRTREGFASRLTKYFQRQASAKVENNEWDEIEEILLSSDVGVGATTKLISQVKAELSASDEKGMHQLFREASEALLAGPLHGELNLEGKPKPYVISIIGVNGVGKTTTTGKLAAYFRARGKTVLLGAADTFRAGAIAQLKVWADRTGADFVTGREGADPGAVSFDSVTAGKARGSDIVLLDTAGRLHTKDNLMEELKKIHRVIKKVIPEAPHERWLVLDGTLGQNSLRQAKEFNEALDLTGIVVTKLDGTAKGGVVFSIVSELGLPIRFIGLGEKAEDLKEFSPRPFVEAILG